MQSAAPKPDWNGPPIHVGVIGGSGLYKLEGIEIIDSVLPETPWGLPSSPLSIARTPSGTLVAFLARHGLSHSYSPSGVPALANIAALKHIGVRVILAFSAVGSLREEIAPKDFVIASQIIDRTKGIRRSTYFGEGEEKNVVAHASFGEPFDVHLRPIVEGIARETLASHNSSVRVHSNKTVVCMEGPAFSTRAESLMYRQLGGDIINMSVIPEAKLAREAEMSYVLIATATDYDAWRESSEAVNVAEVIKSLQANAAASQVVTKALVDKVAELVEDDNSKVLTNSDRSMRFSIMTRPENVDEGVQQRIRYILPWYGSQ
ncbi:S-methyl-5'-thioadenosine phosphorylase [Malassezia vespertilionis]|uniref:S-methyl-5'-thioadenosine phosphorylase n=1 Tax=Malassezia vespertilionis TaxID=2020962 RepID=A0A2N1JED5_9BASI|nr:S-methyl-5'-thioadenosine phosphorylase [Malassezia vespertilionis]PKI84911.1 Meu1p [Malassezia vespertilionis]WFD05624.1 S-methyl-5'-thioadenosine phosphorylase [Malassezia vespertilionis]